MVSQTGYLYLSSNFVSLVPPRKYCESILQSATTVFFHINAPVEYLALLIDILDVFCLQLLAWRPAILNDVLRVFIQPLQRNDGLLTTSLNILQANK